MYLRVMRRDRPDTYDDDEVARVRAHLRSGPGVAEVSSVSQHPRGGHAVHLTVDGSMDALLGYFATGPYVLVL